ncbi:hypothetical protein [Hydrogenophaga sp.]|uniref:hypothetical protein n=1 Tax=Hydrogenophaga sp. TaxID=1904254 RepID=UPI0025C2BF70|nr:hypothetical protein [Hydrogenophaga sp.]
MSRLKAAKEKGTSKGPFCSREDPAAAQSLILASSTQGMAALTTRSGFSSIVPFLDALPLAEVMAVLIDHERLDAEQRRRTEQEMLVARQRFD